MGYRRWAAGLGMCLSAAVLGSAMPAPAAAQGWPDWANGAFGPNSTNRVVRARPAPPQAVAPQPRLGPGVRVTAPPPFAVSALDPDDDDDKPKSLEVLSGGPRPDIDPQAPPVVAFHGSHQANSIVIDQSSRRLYFVLPGNRAYMYRIAVGREGFSWTGSEKISRKQEWPDWHPPAEMRERDPRLPIKMTGGIRNPLGAKALYLGNTLYRIHGTNDAASIGRASSSGCFRMLNAQVEHLASITAIGARVSVVNGLSSKVAAAPAKGARGAQ